MPAARGVPTIVGMELRQHALRALLLSEPEQKVALAHELHALAATIFIANETPSAPAEPAALPGHPERPVLLRHTEMARRSPATHAGRAVLLHDIVARMALVPRTLEARGLDATPLIQAKLRQVGTPDALAAVSILDTILREEVGHVAIGNHWYRWLCARDGLEPEAHYATLVKRYEAPRPRPPFNEAARRLAGFSETELQWLHFGA